MVDVSAKRPSAREAVASGRIRIGAAAMRLARRGRLAKGGVVEVARLAGILAAKRTSEAIPLCHPLPLTHVSVEVRPRRDGFAIQARMETLAPTGAEMEALHACATAAVTSGSRTCTSVPCWGTLRTVMSPRFSRTSR
mgnify:CR=1 FL=1